MVKVKNLFRILGGALLLLLLFATKAVGKSNRPGQPNVMLLLTDDLGWQDIKCYDIDEPSPMETPNMDALAQRGVMSGRPTPPDRFAPQVGRLFLVAYILPVPVM